jgi:hypothetical protein
MQKKVIEEVESGRDFEIRQSYICRCRGGIGVGRVFVVCGVRPVALGRIVWGWEVRVMSITIYEEI